MANSAKKLKVLTIMDANISVFTCVCTVTDIFQEVLLDVLQLNYRYMYIVHVYMYMYCNLHVHVHV